MEWSEEYWPLREEWLVAWEHPFFTNRTFVTVKEKFFLKELKASFRNGSVIIVAGCYALYTVDIWYGLRMKGPNTLIGWRGEETPMHMDKAVTYSLRRSSSTAFLDRGS